MEMKNCNADTGYANMYCGSKYGNKSTIKIFCLQFTFTDSHEKLARVDMEFVMQFVIRFKCGCVNNRKYANEFSFNSNVNNGFLLQRRCFLYQTHFIDFERPDSLKSLDLSQNLLKIESFCLVRTTQFITL